MQSSDLVGPSYLARSSRSVRGFTLIELMVVVAIAAILAGIAIPAYQDAVRKSKRGQAKADLVALAQRAERFNTVNNTYAGFWATVAAVDQVSPRAGTGTPAYALNRDAGVDTAVNTFSLTATPQNNQVKDTRCMTLSLNQLGQKNKSGSGTVAECW